MSLGSAGMVSGPAATSAGDFPPLQMAYCNNTDVQMRERGPCLIQGVRNELPRTGLLTPQQREVHSLRVPAS